MNIPISSVMVTVACGTMILILLESILVGLGERLALSVSSPSTGVSDRVTRDTPTTGLSPG